MNDGKIHIPAKRIRPNQQGVIKISDEAFCALAEVVNESGRSTKEIASQIILQAINKNLIVFDREE